MKEKEFREMYESIFMPDSITNHRTVCGECVYYVNGCTTSELENKYGNGSTPSCSDFKLKEKDNE